MILVDPRNGSRLNRNTNMFEPVGGLLSLLQGKGVEVEEFEMPFGDASFEGNGPNGRCMIGLERKRIADLINSIRTGRLATVQLPGLWQMYQYRFLIVEGIYRPSPQTGILEMPWRTNGKTEWRPPKMGTSRTTMYSEVSRGLTTLQLRYPGLIVIYTPTPQETAYHILDKYFYFNSKTWDQHRAHESFQTDGHVEIIRASLLRRVAKECDGVGWNRSKSVEGVFSSVTEFANANVKELEQIPGVGKVLAKRIFDELRWEKQKPYVSGK